MNRWLSGTVLLLVLCLLPLETQAKRKKKRKQEPFKWEEITKTDWDVIADTDDSVRGAIMLFEKVTDDITELSTKETCHHIMYRRIRILNSNGLTWANVEVPFLDPEQKVPDIQGRTILPDGEIILLQPDQVLSKKALETKAAKLIQKVFFLPGATDNCIIEYAIKYRLPDHVPDWVFQQDIRLLYGEYRWVLPKDNPISRMFILPNFVWQNTDGVGSYKLIDSAALNSTLLFKVTDVPAYVEEPFSLPDYVTRARLLCFYTSPGNPRSFWATVAYFVRQDIDEFCLKDKRVRKVIESFPEMESDEEKILAAVNWIRSNIRLVSLWDYYENEKLIGNRRRTKSQLDEMKTNEHVDDLIKRGYGNPGHCSFLLYHMLNLMGVDAKVAPVVDRDKALFDREAKIWQFHRFLVATSVDEYEHRFYGPGEPYLQTGVAPWMNEGSSTLVMGDTLVFATVPYSEPEFSLTWREYEFLLSRELEIQGRMHSRTTGHTARTIRLGVGGEKGETLTRALHGILEGTFPGADLDSVEIDGLEESDQPLLVSCQAIHPPVTPQGERLFLEPFEYFSYTEENPFTSADRHRSIEFPYAHKLEESATFKWPPNWQLEAVPSDTTFSNRIGECNVSFADSAGVLTVRRSFVLDFPSWRAEDYDEARTLFQAWGDLNNAMVVLKRVGN